MGTPVLWSGVSVSMQSALGATKTISGITKANPGVATSASHGITNGTYLLHLISGMRQLNNRVFRAANIATNTWELEGEDTTNYDTFSAGTAAAITFGTVLSTITDVQASGGEAERVPTTTIHDTQATELLGVTSPLVFALQGYWDPSDAGQRALIAASILKAFRCFHVAWPDGRRALFYGQVSAPGNPTGGAQQLVSTPFTVTSFGQPTYYST